MKIEEGRLSFNFTDAIDAFKFDEEDKISCRYHGLSYCMKAVDFIVEYEDHYLFVEVKNPRSSDFSRYEEKPEQSNLVNVLIGKFRDTFLYRWAEGKLEKPVDYCCLVAVDNALAQYLNEELNKKLPACPQRLPARWQRPLVRHCSVANFAAWNKNFPHMPVTQLTDSEP